jgi:PAS domain S-box-containing protein
LEQTGNFTTRQEYLTRNHSVIPVKLSGVKIELQDGSFILITVEKIASADSSAINSATSELTLQSILDQLPQFIFLKDRNSVYLGCNQKLAEVAGKSSPAEMIGKTDYDLAWKTEESDWFRECDRRVIESGTSEYGIIEPQKQADGSERWLKTNKIPLRDAQGNVIGIVGTFEDISDRVELEKQLKEQNITLETLITKRTQELAASQARYERLSLNVPGTIYQFKWDADGSLSFPYMSSGCEELCGVSPDVVMTKADSILSLIHPHDIQGFKDTVATSAKTLQPKKWEGRIISPSGKIKWIQSASRPQRQADGSIIWDGLMIDISDRKEAEQKLRESQQLLQLVFDTLPQCIYWKDKDSRYLGCNQQFAQDVGLYTPEEVIGKTDSDLAWKKYAHLDRAEDELIMAGGTPKIDKEEIRTSQEGQVFCLRTNKIALKNEQGQVIGIFGSYEDISDRQEKQQQIEAAKDFLDKVIDSIGNPVFVQDAEHKWVLLNDAFYQFLGNVSDSVGLSKEELIGKSDYDVFSKEQADMLWAKDELVMVTGETDTHEEHIMKPNGKQLVVLTKKVCFEDLQGNTFLVGTIIDSAEF